MTDKQSRHFFKLVSGNAPFFEQLRQQRRKMLFYLFAFIGIPVLSLYSIHHFMSQHYLEGICDAAVAFFLGGSLLSFKFIKRAEYIYQTCIVLVGLLFLYLVYVGGDHGAKLLWMYTFPLFAFFMTGRSYGLFYSTAALFAVGFLFFNQEMTWFTPYPYENYIKTRFIISYSIVSGFTFIFEYVRYQFQKGMEKEHALLLEKQKDLTRANTEIRILSLHDHLTGCYNRLYLNKYFAMEIQRSERYSKPLSIIMCDIDYFKKVNDTYGHQAGDSVLKAVALSLRSHIREKIDWVARYGGEEFIIVLPETELERALIVADRLLQAISAISVDINEQTITVTASFGVSGSGAEPGTKMMDSDAFINMADRFLYAAKTQGRNRVVGESHVVSPSKNDVA